MKLSFFICIFRSNRNFHAHVGNFIWKTYYIALRLCNKTVYASSRNLYARSLKIRKINYFLTWISYIFDVLKFDLGVDNSRRNLNKLLSIASLWTHCWKDTIITSSSDVYCNFYRFCPRLIIYTAIYLYEISGNPLPCDQWICCRSLNEKHLKANKYGKHGLYSWKTVRKLIRMNKYTDEL